MEMLLGMLKMFQLFGLPMFCMSGLFAGEGEGGGDGDDQGDGEGEGGGDGDGDGSGDGEGEEEGDKNYDWQKDFDEKGAEEITKEAKRKGDKIRKQDAEISDLRKKLEEFEKAKNDAGDGEGEDGKGVKGRKEFRPLDRVVSRFPQAKAAVSALKAAGFTKEMIDNLSTLIAYMGVDISDSFVKPLSGEFAGARFKNAMDEFSKDKRYKFAMEKPEIRAEVEKFVREKYPDAMSKPENIRHAYLEVRDRHPELFKKSSRQIIGDGTPSGDEGEGHDSGAGGIASRELISFAKGMGYEASDLKNPVIKRKVEDAFKAEKKYAESKKS